MIGILAYGMSRPELARYVEQLGELGDEAVELTSALTNDQFNWRPAPNRWSVGECFDHLNTAGLLLLPLLDDAIDEGRRQNISGAPPDRYGFISRWFIRGNAPDPLFKMKTARVYRPSSEGRLDRQRALERFSELQNALAARVQRSDGLDLKKIKVHSPVSSLIRVSLGAWFEATIAHEKRHLNQARAVMREPEFP